jgi:hypothetical protein
MRPLSMDAACPTSSSTWSFALTLACEPRLDETCTLVKHDRWSWLSHLDYSMLYCAVLLLKAVCYALGVSNSRSSERCYRLRLKAGRTFDVCALCLRRICTATSALSCTVSPVLSVTFEGGGDANDRGKRARSIVLACRNLTSFRLKPCQRLVCGFVKSIWKQERARTARSHSTTSAPLQFDHPLQDGVASPVNDTLTIFNTIANPSSPGWSAQSAKQPSRHLRNRRV